MGRQAPHPLPGNILPLVSVGLELGNLRAFRITASVASEAQRRRRAPGDAILLGALMATGAGNSLGNVSFVRKLDRLLNRRYAPINPITEGQDNENNYQSYDCSFHPRSCGQ